MIERDLHIIRNDCTANIIFYFIAPQKLKNFLVYLLCLLLIYVVLLYCLIILKVCVIRLQDGSLRVLGKVSFSQQFRLVRSSTMLLGLDGTKSRIKALQVQTLA
jgi:hypothetical protein